MTESRGALAGLKVVEIAGIGPGPFAGMMLADHGAEVIRVERIGTSADRTDILSRSRVVVQADLKSDEGVAKVVELSRHADALIEGFRPGVMERLGLGPEKLLAENPRLVYARITGWGQEGRLAAAAGHDIDYIALAGVLNALGRAGEKPTPPINLVGDFGGGGMMAAFGILAGILSARATGNGQVVDCAMTDGSALLMSMIWGFRAKGIWSGARGTNYLDSGAPYYDTYETSDGKYVAVGAIEAPFYAELLRRTGLDGDALLTEQDSSEQREAQRRRFASLFASRSRDEWCALLEGTDACFAPVLSFDEAPAHPHNAERQLFLNLAGVTQPAPAPRYSLTPAPFPRAPGESARRT